MSFTFTDCKVESRNEDGAWTLAPDGTKRFFYLLRVDDDGHETLRWLERRGYDCGMFAALERTEQPEIVAIPEHKAWEIREACYDKPDLAGNFVGFACLSWESPIGLEITRFLDSIV